MRRRGLPKHMADVTDSFPVWTRREQMELDGPKYEVRTIGTGWRHKPFISAERWRAYLLQDVP